MLNAGYRVWIHEVRPSLNPETGACEVPRGPDDGRCVLLACLDVNFVEVANELQVDGEVTIDRTCGPILVQTRLLQEFLLYGAGGGAAAPLLGSPPDGGGGGAVVAPMLHSDLNGLGADDHDQYLLVNPADRSLIANLDAGTNLISNLGEAGAPTGSEAVRWDRAVKNGDAAGGDLSGSYPNPQVQSLQGNPVSPNVLTPGDAGDVLVWDGGTWVNVPGPFTARPTRIIGLSWRHGAQMLLSHTHDGAAVSGLAVAFGRTSGVLQRVQSGTLNNDTMRVFIRIVPPGAPATIPVFSTAELQPDSVLAVDATLAGSRVVSTVTPGNPDLANAVLFLIDDTAASQLAERNAQLFIELTGDHVLDADGRAIDAEFPRTGLPSGDGPGDATLGIQGGHFYSNVTVGLNVIAIGGFDLNAGNLDDIRGLPGIGDVIAGRIIVERRRRGGFDSLEDLADIRGVTRALLDDLRALLDN